MLATSRSATLSARIALASLLALVTLTLSWELWLAPIRPGGSWLVIKALPLLAPLRGILHQRPRTFQWSSMLVLAYLCEGVVRGVTEYGNSKVLALAQALISVVYFVSAINYVRTTRAH